MKKSNKIYFENRGWTYKELKAVMKLLKSKPKKPPKKRRRILRDPWFRVRNRHTGLPDAVPATTEETINQINEDAQMEDTTPVDLEPSGPNFQEWLRNHGATYSTWEHYVNNVRPQLVSNLHQLSLVPTSTIAEDISRGQKRPRQMFPDLQMGVDEDTAETQIV